MTAAEAEVVAVLSDEELAVLTHRPSPVVLPHLDDVPAAHLDAVLLTAYRGLVARGWVHPPPAAAIEAAARSAAASSPVALPVRLAGELDDVLRLRADAAMVACVQRTTAEGQDHRYCHLGGRTALDELVSPDGLHAFRLIPSGDLLPSLAAYVLDPGADGAPGPEHELDPVAAAGGRAPAALLERLARATLVADVVVRRAGDAGAGPMLGILSGPDGTHVVESWYGSTRPVVLRSVAPAGVPELLRALLDTPEGQWSGPHGGAYGSEP
ncbi:MAG: hypothetical protein ACRDWI_18310 [Jiangellaceae bacterium]